MGKLNKLISNSFIQMIYKDGFVHADPHPGNLFIRKKTTSHVKQNGGKVGDLELVILDHGIYTTLSDDTRHNYVKLWRGILS